LRAFHTVPIRYQSSLQTGACQALIFEGRSTPLPRPRACGNYLSLMTPLETYLRELRDIRSTGAGAEEESYYHPLATLLNEVGKKLKPKVKCVLQLANRGAGKPDGGLFTAEQFEHLSDAEPLPGQLPARGAIEVKPTKDDAWVTAEAKQVTKYWNRYRQVLVTNYRDFVLVGQDAESNPAILETYRLAESEKAFWQAAATPRSTAEKQNDRFVEYLQRVMRHGAPIAAPEDVAWFLASYARDALAAIRGVELSALGAVRAALEEALGLKFEGEKGEHFFRSSLVQTLFYGIFSAWVLWSRHNPPTSRNRFDWRLTIWSLRVPMISRLFLLIANPNQLDALKLSEVLNWTGAVLNRVDRASFFSNFEESHAVQYFYEPFLEAFDPELRKQLGVWYTPPEIVKYMVERVDTVLRQELGLPLGLADKNVYVLDPCCGTGSYLVEVLDRIHRTLKECGENGLTASDLKEAAQKRVFGFEILPAPFVVSHLQLGLLLQKLGVPLSDGAPAQVFGPLLSHAIPVLGAASAAVAPGFSPARAALRGATYGPERVAVFLTNSLTGWEPPKGPKQHLIFPEMEQERDAAEYVKQQAKILVVLGNPPYNGFAGVAVAEERDLTNAYRTTNRAPAPQGQGLNDLYVRFYRMAERRIVEMSGRGVVCFISNYSWLDGLSFTGMRERYLDAFDCIWIDCLNGDKYKTGKLTPEGEPDPSVFSTEFNPEGIQVGTAIALLARTTPVPAVEKEKSQQDAGATGIRFRHVWGKTKRQQLLESAAQDGQGLYQQLEPPLELGLPFAPAQVDTGYLAWPLLPDLFPVSFPGVKTSRDDVVVDIDRERLLELMELYFDPEVSHEEMRRVCPSVMTSTARFKAEAVRDYLCERGFLEQNLVRYCYRPFDARWLYWEGETKLLDEKRSEYFPHVFAGNGFMFTTGRTRKSLIEPALFCCTLCDLNSMDSGARGFPLYLDSASQHKSLIPGYPPSGVIDLREGARPNASESLIHYIGKVATGGEMASPFYHTIAILHSRAYRNEHIAGLRSNWPRIPLPDSKELLLASAALGRKIAAQLDTEAPFDVGAPLVGALAGRAQGPPLQRIGVPTRMDGKALDETNDLAVTAGWGHAGKGGVTMPGKGRLIERDYTPEERQIMLGDRTCDVYLNDVAYWKNIPLRVWEYTIGGYQVVKKWLSYREEKLLGRPMTKDEVRWVQEMARRIAAILLLEPLLDENYRAVKAHTYEWPKNG